jgi:hypothetical protein
LAAAQLSQGEKEMNAQTATLDQWLARADRERDELSTEIDARGLFDPYNPLFTGDADLDYRVQRADVWRNYLVAQVYERGK